MHDGVDEATELQCGTRTLDEVIIAVVEQNAGIPAGAPGGLAVPIEEPAAEVVERGHRRLVETRRVDGRNPT